MFKKRTKQYNLDKKYLLKNFSDKKNKKILDFGCGNGNFLKKFKSKKYGYEFNLEAKRNRSITYLEYKEIDLYKFDAIIMRGVIEHIPKFYLVLKKLFRSF